MLIANQNPLSKRQTYAYLVGILLVAGFISSLGHFVDEPYVVRRNKGYCCLNLESQTGVFRAILAITLAAYSIPTLIVLRIYYQLWSYLFNAMSQDRVPTDSAPQKNPATTHLQTLIAKRGLYVFLVYLAGYTYPVLYHIIKAAIPGEAPVMYDNLNIWMITLNTVGNPIVYMLCEPRLPAVLAKFFGRAYVVLSSRGSSSLKAHSEKQQIKLESDRGDQKTVQLDRTIKGSG
ncbi:hypothetical protein HDU91_003030 [Kappamyces sp. JEL0680]|nr:hypothetical protein HDU91_003030 [Kappamyces sp. JEL0680]